MAVFEKDGLTSGGSEVEEAEEVGYRLDSPWLAVTSVV